MYKWMVLWKISSSPTAVRVCFNQYTQLLNSNIINSAAKQELIQSFYISVPLDTIVIFEHNRIMCVTYAVTGSIYVHK